MLIHTRDNNSIKILNYSIFSKILLILGFFTLSVILYIIYKTPNAIGYELTIYDAFPNYFFLLFILVYFFGYICIFWLIYIKEEKTLKYLPPFLLILINNSIFLMLTKLHGYLLYGRGDGDVLVHIGLMKDIIFEGYINRMNFYPIIHIIGVVTHYFLNLSFENIVILIYVAISNALPFFMYFLFSSMFRETWKKMLGVTFSTLLLFSSFQITLHPSILSVFFFPLIFGSFQYKNWKKKNLFESSIILLILIFFLTYMHPLTTIFLIIVFISYLIAALLTKNKVAVVNLIIISIVSFFSWYFNNSAILNFSTRVFQDLMSEVKESTAGHYVNIYKSIDLSIYTTMELIFWRYGHIIILFIISTFFIIQVIKKYTFKRISNIVCTNYLFLQIFAFVSVIFLLAGNFIESEILRITRFGIILSLITCSLFFIYNSKKNRKFYILSAFIVIIFLSSFFIFNLYSSSRNVAPNYQLTQMEFFGVNWIISNKDSKILFVSDINFNKNIIYFEGQTGYDKQPRKGIKLILPTNFNYTTNKNLAEVIKDQINLEKPYYTTYNKYMEINYLLLPKEIWNIASKYDKKYIINDSTVNIIYSSGEYENWLIK